VIANSGFLRAAAGLAVVLALGARLQAGQSPSTASRKTPPTTGASNSSSTKPTPGAGETIAPQGYVIGPDDVLTIVFWREKDLSGDVAVRPDGRISLPLINEINAAGLTPEQLRIALTKAADQYVEEPTVTVMVKVINSRKVFITGQVAKPAPYPLIGPTTVLQLITIAGGLLEYADSENIGVVRTVDGKPTRFRFNYKDVIKGKNLAQNIELKPGDQIVVP
jgi:polysaccharide export outer membrane protein